MKSPHSIKSLLPAITLGMILSSCGGGSGDSHQATAARQLRPTQKTSAANSQYETLVQQLYVSFFGRPADPTGLANFEGALAAANAPADAQSLLQIYTAGTNPAVNKLVDSFGTSAESQALYGNGTTTQFVDAIFTNVLNREPAQAGLDFWVDAIDSGKVTRGSASLQIMEGALTNTTAQGLLDKTLVDNRIAVAEMFTDDIQTPEELRGYAGAAAAQTARAVLSGVTATTVPDSLATSVDATVESLQRYLIGGTLSGLASGENMVLLDNGGDALTLTANGTYDFATSLLVSAPFDVTIGTQPIGELCTVSTGSGNVVSDVNFANVSCHFPYAYVVNLTSDTVSQYALQANGALTVDTTASVATGKSPSAIAIAPGYKSLYVTNQGDNSISEFNVNADGSLTAGAAIPTQFEPAAVAVTPNGKYAYVANFGTTTVSQYGVQGSGALAALSPATVTAGTAPTGIAIDPTSSHVYVLNNGSQTVAQFTINASGGLTPMSVATVGTGTSPLAIGITPSGANVYVVNDAPSDHSISQYSVGSNGSLTPLSPAKISVGSTPAAIAFDPAGKNAYVVDSAGAVWQMSIGSGGALSQVGSTSVTTVSGFAVDPSGRFAYATSKGGTVSQFAVGSSGGLTPLSPATVNAGLSPFGIVVNF